MHPLSLCMQTNLVLTFHQIPSAHWFRNTLITIKKIFNFISIEDIEAYYYYQKKFNNSCHICFDDANVTFYKYAFPVLKEMNVPATLFVSPKIIKGNANFWFQELCDMAKQIDETMIKQTICEVINCNYKRIEKYSLMSIFKCMEMQSIVETLKTIKQKYIIKSTKRHNIGIEEFNEINDSDLITIGAHTMNHPILRNENDNQVRREIRESVEGLSRMIGRGIKYFAYPNGEIGLDFNLREQLILRENGIKLAFSTNTGFFNKKTNQLSILRSGLAGIERENTLWLFAKLFFIPVWDMIRCQKDIRERKEIYELSIF